MNSHDELINALSHELAPSRPVPSVNMMAFAWLVASALYVVAITHLFGPIRPAALIQLTTEPRFLLESLLGVAAISVSALAGFRAAIPGALNASLARLATVVMILWLASYLFGLYSPALEPSMAGKRPHCLVETFIYGIPPIGFALLLVRRLYPLRPMRTALALSLAAGMLPALYMQIACMYSPAHILQFHILPGMALVLVGAALAVLLLRRPVFQPP
jgi:hypothetical protein